MVYVVSARPLGQHRVRLRFEDGASGTVDIAKLVPFDGVFAPLRQQSYFRKLSVYSDGGGTIYWPNGADIDPEVLYAEVTGTPIVWRGRVVYRPVGARIALPRRSRNAAALPPRLARRRR
jgi:hypothetical protein